MKSILLLLALSCIYSVAVGNKLSRRSVIIERPKVSTRQRPTSAEYYSEREKIFEEEGELNFGHDIQLNEAEVKANEILMSAKNKEVEAGFENPYSFLPSRHLFSVLDQIKSSELFQIIRKMPKGAILHAHDTALVSADYLVTLTQREYLWQCNKTDTTTVTFQFSRVTPATTITGCTWRSVSAERQRVGDDVYDANVRRLFTMMTDDPSNDFKDINDMWTQFMNIFITVDPILTYAPVWRDYYYQALKEMHEDGVQYLEFRGTLPPVYDLDGKIYSPTEVVALYEEVLAEFKANNPDFIGSRFIYAPLRSVNDATFEEYIETVKELHVDHPAFLAGFDLVGQEDLGRPLIDYAEKILEIPDEINFFFHAGETNWYGRSTDDNLIDAVLLGTHRIGHGFALVKHPKVMELVKSRQIAVEVNPVSNQVLKLVDDYRNHPCSVFFANDVPVVISSDDPSFWEVTPLTHDFYEAFLGIASTRSDLRTLKKLAMNSLEYSSLNATEKAEAFQKWQLKWDKFIDELVASKSVSA